MPERENVKNVNIVKREQIRAETFAFGDFWRRLSHLGKFNTCQWHSACTKFGHSKDLITLSLSLSLSLSQVLTYNSLYIIKLRGHPRQDTAFFASVQGKSDCFFIA